MIMPTDIAGLKKIPIVTSRDSRGYFTKLYSEDFYKTHDFDFKIAQINLSVTEETGTVRGLHYQLPPFSERKVIRCLRGRVFDVIVDIRHDSSSFLKYETFELSEDNGFALHVPAGCAHGFQVLDGPAELLYVHSEEYRPDYEAGINPFDPQLLINWPVAVTQISERDKSFPSLHKSFKGINV